MKQTPPLQNASQMKRLANHADQKARMDRPLQFGKDAKLPSMPTVESL